MEYSKVYGKSIKTNPHSKLNEDTIAKKQVTWKKWRTYTKVRLSRCAAGKNIVEIYGNMFKKISLKIV